MEEIQALFKQERLKRNHIGSSYSILDAPLSLIWSKTTKSITVRFKYTAYTSSSKTLLQSNSQHHKSKSFFNKKF